jgi:hypothetical protein
MMIWYPALVVVLALCCTAEAKMRTWSALAISSLFGWFLPPLAIGSYIIVDTLAAALVLRSPAGVAQRLVGLGFAGMILFHVGYVISPQTNWQEYYRAQEFVGWVQLLLLGVWGVRDGLVALSVRLGGREMDRVARVP